MPTLETLPFDNAFARLPSAFYTRLPPEPLPEPYLVAASPAAAALIGVNHEQSHEGEAAMRLEALATCTSAGDALPLYKDGSLWRADWAPLLLLLAVLLGAYTGFLLSALKTYPLLNNPVLPVLFLISGVSSGIASTILLAVTLFKENHHSQGVSFVHRFERPVLAVEVLLLVCFFTGLYFGGGQKEAAMWAAIGSGFWAQVFWLGVVGIGMLLPQLLALLAPAPLRAKNGYLVLVCSLTLVGILLLRYFVLYAGQMTVV